MVEEDGRVPLIDIGTLAKIRDGSIAIRGGIDRLTADGVIFADGKRVNNSMRSFSRPVSGRTCGD